MIKLVLSTAICFLILDAICFGYVAKSFYIQNMGALIDVKNGSIQTNFTAVFLVYLILIGGIIIFVHPLAGQSVYAALIYGALFGLISYGTYDLTNQAVIKDWSWTVTAIDILWGMTICGITSVVGWYFK